MQSLLDYRTLLAASGIAGGALLMLLPMQFRHPYPGFLQMVLGMDILAVAFIGGGLSGYAPDSVWTLQVTVLATFGLIDAGVRRFCGAPRRGKWPLFYVLFGLALQTYLYFTQPLHLRIIATSLLIIPIAFDVGIVMLKTMPEGRRFGYQVVAAVALLTCVTSFVRLGAIASLRHEASPYFADSFGNTLFFLLVLVLVVSMVFGISTLAHERLVDELKAEHDAKVRMERELAKAERTAPLGRVAAGVAHFFNNQLCTIQLACSMLQDSSNLSKTAIASLVEQIDRAGRRSVDITNQLLQYAQSKILRTSRFDPSLLLDGILAEVRATAGEKVEVITSSPSTVPVVELDADLLKETLLVLTRNARDAMPAGGRLTISLREEMVDVPQAGELSLSPGTFVVTSVADTGRGMDEETQRHLFEPFYTTKGLAHAEGLGLASAYGFIRQSGGTITVSSTPDHGSKFDLYLPTASGISRPVAA
jgi:signal transduction histidine kinase